MSLLDVDGLNSYYGDSHILFDVALRVERNEVVALLGRNGAGKSTTLKSLMGVVQPRSGRIVFDGADIAGTRPHAIAHRGIARSFQRTNVFPALSVLDNVWVAAFARQDRWAGLLWRRTDRYPALEERALSALGEVGLRDKARVPAREISHGEQRQLELAIALAAAPRLLLLDEPAAGLSPDETGKMITLLAGLKGRYTIVLVEHKMDVIMTISDRISVMSFGALIAEGTPAEIQRNPDVRRAYLGGMPHPDLGGMPPA
jgi:branched-chain amino acid transport system ATP-binding protein